MARLMEVDYEAIPAIAKRIRVLGQDLNNEVSTAYTNISNMHSSWYGKRYNELVTLFNNLIPQINDILSLAVQEIPFALETVANNYSQADTGTNVVGAERSDVKKITNLTVPSDVGMKFISAEVSNIKDTVSTNFKNAKGKMDEIESTYDQITWQSEASDAFRAKFTKLKQQIASSFEQIDVQFSKLMTEALDDVQNVENTIANS